MYKEIIIDASNFSDTALLINILPERYAGWLEQNGNADDLLELVLDLGRPGKARYLPSGHEIQMAKDDAVTQEDINHIVGNVSDFSDDNRAGISGTLHRISAIRNRRGIIIGLTCRVGRYVPGSAIAIADLIQRRESVLLLGPPGVGKTTMLREVARLLADDLGRRVVIVDTSNEIAGDGDIPHDGVGSSRRMQVPHTTLQHQLMIEAVENHTPEVIVIDEIGTEQEALAARTISERGVQLIGTAHGNTLSNLMDNPTLCDLIGGIESVTLGDDTARDRNTQKTVLERRANPTFTVLVEIKSFEHVEVYEDVADTVDKILRGEAVEPLTRRVIDGRLAPQVRHRELSDTTIMRGRKRRR